MPSRAGLMTESPGADCLGDDADCGSGRGSRRRPTCRCSTGGRARRRRRRYRREHGASGCAYAASGGVRLRPRRHGATSEQRAGCDPRVPGQPAGCSDRVRRGGCCAPSGVLGNPRSLCTRCAARSAWDRAPRLCRPGRRPVVLPDLLDADRPLGEPHRGRRRRRREPGVLLDTDARLPQLGLVRAGARRTGSAARRLLLGRSRSVALSRRPRMDEAPPDCEGALASTRSACE